MASDAHAHPRDLWERCYEAESERRLLGIACAASSWNPEEFSFNRELARRASEDGGPTLFLCCAIHPQLPAAGKSGTRGDYRETLDFLEEQAAAGSLAALGETGFDLYDERFRETEAVQDRLFAAHLEIALGHDLPLVLHVRRAMKKIFFHTKALKRLPAVVFHSWPGASDEGFSLLRRGVNVYFSFGTTLLLNHKNAIRSCAAFPKDRLLVETDAPWQPLRGSAFSRWTDLALIRTAAAAIRQEAGALGGTTGEELETITDKNFFTVFGH